MRHHKLNPTLLVVLALCWSFVATGQLNPSYQKLNIKAGQIYELEINSIDWQPDAVDINFPYEVLEFVEAGPNLWTMQIQFEEGFAEDVNLDIEYYDYGDVPGILYPFYSSLKMRVQPTEVSSVMDAFVVNGLSETVYPLDNDFSSDYDISLSNIAFVQNCTAEIVDNDGIQLNIIDPDLPAYIQYVCEDDLLVSSNATIMLYSSNMESDLFELQTNNLSSINLIVDNNYDVSLEPANGVLTSINNYCWEYQPNSGYSGVENIVFSNDENDEVTFSVTVYDNPNSIQFANDDEVYVATNGTVNFNVLTNDLLNYFPVVDYSSELTYLNNGDFSFVAQTDFTGDEIFYYTIFNGISFVTADIIIHVDDFAPYSTVDYLFNAYVDQPLVIEHNSPMNEYTISLVSAPQNGEVIILDESGNEVLDCATISGANKIIYTAENSGDDVLEIEYCTDSGICEIVKIDFNNLNQNFEDCLCLEDCVYNGDINNDGKVDVGDIVALGNSVGEKGEARENIDAWVPQTVNPWIYTQDYIDEDLSYADADGNGLVDQDDVSAIETYYGATHNLLPQISYELLEAPIVLDAQQSEVDSGELLIIDVLLGSDSNPLFDIQGLSFSYNISGDVIDSSSVSVQFLDDSWLNYGAPQISYFDQPTAGDIHVGFSRVGSRGSSGQGPIATIEFIVEDDLVGFKLQDLLFKMNMSITDAIVMNNRGRKFSLPYFETSVDLNLGESNIDLDSYIDINPNPAHDYLSVNSDKFEIDRIEIYSVDGINIQTKSYNNQFKVDCNLADLPAGTYIIKVVSNNKQMTSKFVKI